MTSSSDHHQELKRFAVFLGLVVVGAAFTYGLPKAEAQRNAMQSSLAQGWAPWYDMSYTKLVRLPEGSTPGQQLSFHAPDGSGYAFFARALKKLDGINPQIADNSIHAVSIKTFTRAEWEKAQKMGLA